MNSRILTQLLVLAALCCCVQTALAQGTTFTYQGRLVDAGQPADGTYDLTFSLWDAATGPSQIGGTLTNLSMDVANGFLTVALNFGHGIFDGSPRWLEVGVRTNAGGGYVSLSPRQPLTPTPYAWHSYSVAASNLTGTLSVSTLPPNVVQSDQPQEFSEWVRFTGPVEFDFGGGPAFAVTSSAEVIPGLNAEMLGNRPAAGFWQTGGNAGTTAGTHFLGTTDNQPLELRVNSLRALRLEPTTGTPNVIGGHPANTVSPGLTAVTIGGGGSATEFHQVSAGGATIGGGMENQVGGIVGTVGGGQGNIAASPGATVSGGAGNLATNDFTAVGGGYLNHADGMNATVAGGTYNAASGFAAAIGGGHSNQIEYLTRQANIAGGSNNIIQSHAEHSCIGGGRENIIESSAHRSTIGGGGHNLIRTGTGGAVIGGGQSNENGAPWSTIAGGAGNSIEYSAVGSTVAGGENNWIYPAAQNATIGGGNANRIYTNSNYGVISGGWGNGIYEYSASCTIGGGYYNNISTNAEDAVISGGDQNYIGGEVRESSIGGGWKNVITNGASLSVIAGGAANAIGDDVSFGAIGGGVENIIGAGTSVATIPGGVRNEVTADYGFAAGYQAKARYRGCFVWSDVPTNAVPDFASSDENQFLIRASGGVGIGTPAPAKALDVVDGSGSGGQGGNIHVGTVAANGDAKLIHFGDLQANGLGYVYLGENGQDDTLELRAGRFYFNSGNVGIGTALPTTALEVIGTVTATAFNPTSDRNAKEHITAVNPHEVLDKVTSLPITRWNFKHDAGAEHMGPMAQDFHAAFGLGTDDRHIATVDADGVALAAIQGLNQKLEQKEAEIAQLRQELGDLKQLVNSLVSTRSGGEQ